MVVYLRALSEPIRAAAGYGPGELFPLLSVGQIGPLLNIVKIELAREAATLVMLAAAGLAGAGTRRSWLAGFALAFGVWDLAFYASLKVLIDWPQSLMTWDILFLLPVPWTSPVLAPAIVAASLTAGGMIGLLREPARVGRFAWMLLVAGGVIIFTSFIWDWRHIAAGGMPRGFPWLIFATGEIAGVVGFMLAIKKGTDRSVRRGA